MATKFLNLDLDNSLGGNSPSDYKIPSQKAIKTYVDNNSGGGGSSSQVTVVSDNSGNIQLQIVPLPVITDENDNIILNTDFPSISDVVVDQVFDGTSENAQSGVAIAGAGFVTNVVNALGYIPYNGETNPNKYINENTITSQTITTLTSGTIALISNCSMYKHTPSSATTYTFDITNLNIDNTVAYTFELYVNMSSSVYTLTFPSSVKWQNGETPSISTTGTYFFVFRTIDGGTNWFGNLQGKW